MQALLTDDSLQTAGLLAERLQAWKHAVGYMEEYMGAVEKIHKEQAKEYEKVLKVREHQPTRARALLRRDEKLGMLKDPAL